MANWDEELIAATTASAVSDAFTVIGTVTIVSANLGDEITEEGVGIQYWHDGDWYSLYLNGVLQQVTKKHSMITLTATGKYRAVKTATENAVSVVIWKSELST